MARRRLVVGNWKMHKTRAATRDWCAELVALLDEEAPAGADLGVAPPFTSLDTVRAALEGRAVALAAQNCHHDVEGPYTGEISTGMLAELGCEMVILGHSERRQLFGESDALIGKKVAAARDAGLTPILCVGETDGQRTSGRTESVIEAQLRSGLERTELDEPGAVVVAYEPVWAIGTGKVATPSQAQEAHAFLRGILASIVDPDFAERVTILYGGSVKPANAGELSALEDVDGFLVGGASLDPGSFVGIAKALS